jgi:hypothetical protein
VISLFFSSIQVPNEYQRKFILDGCEWLARIQGPDRCSQELLPSCWEQINVSVQIIIIHHLITELRSSQM